MLPCSQISQGELKPPTRIEGPAAHALSQTCNHLTLPCNALVCLPAARNAARDVFMWQLYVRVFMCVCARKVRDLMCKYCCLKRTLSTM